MIGGGYEARFEGGVLDGRTFTVPSLVPTRFAMREASEPRKAPAPSKPVGAKYDRYDLGHWDDESAVYHHNPQGSSR